MKAYIAGKISGNPEYKDKFAEAEDALRWEGHKVLNPADLPEGLSQRDYMRICFAMIDCVDFVAFLPNWEQSAGAKLEHAYCQYVGKQTLFLEKLTAYQNIIESRSRFGF